MLAKEEKADLYLRLMGVTKEISDYMLQREELAQKRIGDIMGGKVLELEVDRMLAHGRQEILEEGRRERNKRLVMRMLESGEQEDKILLYSECTREEVERIREEMAGHQ